MSNSETSHQSRSPAQDTTSECFDSKLISSKLGAKIVAINVSDDTTSKTYWLHSDVLCKASPVFRTAFDGSIWAEGEENRMKWLECDPKAFDVFVHWLYTKHLPSDENLPAQEDKPLLFLKVLALGDRALVPSLQSKAYARIRDTYGKIAGPPSKAFVHDLYRLDLGSNQLRSYTAKLYACRTCQGRLNAEQLDAMMEETPLFAVDLAKELNRRIVGKVEIESPYFIEWYKTYHGVGSNAK